jgi:membrane fusion protein, heavy metal efflux system
VRRDKQEDAMNSALRVTLGIAGVLLAGCDNHAGHGHPHGKHDHGGGDHHADHGEADEPEPIAITRWTDRYELFVELPPPVPGKPVPYHAHITRLSDFAAATEGTFRVRFKNAGGVVAEGMQQGVKRPGIFVFESPAPAAAGEYALEMSYEHEGKVDTFDCGNVSVSDKPPAGGEEDSGNAITFLKESQWKIAFGTAWAMERPLARELEVPATVEAAGSDQLTLGAPTAGRFFHAPNLALAEGLRVKKGEVIGKIVPTVDGEDFSRLQIAVDEARMAREQLQREIQRVEPLVQQGLLPERRLLELRNQLDTQSAKLGAASGRASSVASPQGAGAITIRATFDGVVSQVLVPNGEPVAGGAPLVRLGGTEHVWLRSRFVAKPAANLLGAEPSSLRLPSGEQLSLTDLEARFLSTLPTVDPVSGIATWIVDVAARSATDLRPGTSVILAVRFGESKPMLSVPRGAIVEISTRPFVFVQIDGEHFEKRAVTVGQADGPWIAVHSGVATGERVVTRGGFDIHLAALMGTIESHRH